MNKNAAKIGVLLISTVALFFSCNQRIESLNDESKVIEVINTINKPNESLEFNSFLSEFKTEQYPYELKYASLRMSYFYSEVLTEFEIEHAKKEIEHKDNIDKELLVKWIISKDSTNELSKWLLRILPQIDNDWYTINPGIRLKKTIGNFLTLYTYEKTSAVNGGYWTVWLLNYSENSELVNVVKLGDEGFYTFLDSKDTEHESFWRRHNHNEMIRLNFNNQSDMSVCNFSWAETEGDVDISSIYYYKFNSEDGFFDLILKNKKEKCWNLKDTIKTLFVKQNS